MLLLTSYCYLISRVKLLINHQSGSAVAVKVINLLKHANAKEMVRKEIGLHRRMKHDNILRFFGERFENNKMYLFLEYASGGELFDRIDPDLGMPDWMAQKYFNQIIAGIVSLCLFLYLCRCLLMVQTLLYMFDYNSERKPNTISIGCLFCEIYIKPGSGCALLKL